MACPASSVYVNIFILHLLPSLEICFQGLGGYMKAALWIWSLISSSSLNGNVPLADIHNNTNRPHVQRSIISLVQQNLWGQVGGGADHRATERLLTDDTGKAKVTQLHLKEVDREEQQAGSQEELDLKNKKGSGKMTKRDVRIVMW